MNDRDIQGFWLWLYSLPIYVFDRLFIKPIVDIRKKEAVEMKFECPRCFTVARWINGQASDTGDECDEFWCQVCGGETPLDEMHTRPTQWRSA